MPELPELEIVAEVLSKRLLGRQIREVQLSKKGGPILIRDLTGRGFIASVQGQSVASVARRGKFLLLQLGGGDLIIAVNPKLSGRFQLCGTEEAKAGPVHIRFTLADDEELRYIDSKLMGQVYLTAELEHIPKFDQMGPEPFDLSPEAFAERLSRFRGEIKGILVRGTLVAGIGNAYADEILWRAKLHPYRKRPSLTNDEIANLYLAMQGCLREALAQVRKDMGEAVHLKPRDFFAVHMRGGQACPRCGSLISSVTANQRITNFCRACQPGGLIRGMH